MERDILIFGAGKIGRSFIGQLFGQSGYKVTFADINQAVINELNRRNTYTVVFKGKTEELILVQNVKAVSAMDVNALTKEIAGTSIMAVSVGKNALGKITPVIAEGLKQRHELTPDRPLDIIIAENMRSADEFLRSKLVELLPVNYPFDKLVGLVKTSIGKMVPNMTDEDLEKDPLLIFAESYNDLILDKRGFKGAIPKVKGLKPKGNMKAWVDRKAFIHNLGHATVAYIGNFYHPKANFIFEVLADKNILILTRRTMLQAAEILVCYYPKDFSIKGIEEHIDDLLNRFQNKALKDTVYRVGRDLSRKLGIDDRFAGVIQMAQRKGLEYNYILRAMAYGFYFRKVEDNGKPDLEDVNFMEILNKEGVGKVLESLCGFNMKEHKVLIEELKVQYLKLNYEIEKVIIDNQ